MEIKAIPQSVLFSLFPPMAPGGASDPQKLFSASMMLYLFQLHYLIMQSWKQFGETQKAIAHENDAAHQSRTKRRAEEEAIRAEGQRRYSQLTQLNYLQVGRQASQFCCYDGAYADDGSRHLSVPV